MTTEPEKPPESAPDPPEGEPGFWDKLRSLMDERIGDSLGKLFDSGKADVKDGQAGGDPAPGKGREDVAAEVKREVQKLRDAEARDAADRSLADRVRELEEKLKKAAENPPEEFRRVTEWMWR